MSEFIRMTAAQLMVLPEYSCTVPTGAKAGKRWRRHQPYRRRCSDGPCAHWWLGEYVDRGEPGVMAIRWRKVEFGPQPARPQWSPETD